MKTRILSAAIEYRLIGDSTTRYMRGPNHKQCMEQFDFLGIPAADRLCEREGFLTNALEFVDRQEAYTIAEASGQLISERADRTLFSEDIDYSKRGSIIFS